MTKTDDGPEKSTINEMMKRRKEIEGKCTLNKRFDEGKVAG